MDLYFATIKLTGNRRYTACITEQDYNVLRENNWYHKVYDKTNPIDRIHWSLFEKRTLGAEDDKDNTD